MFVVFSRLAISWIYAITIISSAVAFIHQVRPARVPVKLKNHDSRAIHLRNAELEEATLQHI